MCVVVASMGSDVSKGRNSEAGMMVAVVAITSSIPACHACARLAGQVIAETTARPRVSRAFITTPLSSHHNTYFYYH